ncbi:MAG: acetylxylan esterase [Pirellulaceae bacterium]|nr:acetylxylan esterase [Pirellulaceae bacterium]
MTLALIALHAVPARAEVKVAKEQGGGVTIKTEVYAAAFDAKGNLLHVTVEGAVAFSHTFGNPGQPTTNAPSVNVINNTVAVRDGNRRVEWTFDEEVIRIVQEGYNFECTLDKSVKALVAPGGKGGALGKYNGGTTAVVLANDLTMIFVKPTHIHERRMLPAGYTNGSLKIGELFEGEIKLGAPAEAAQFLGSIVISAVGSGHEKLLQGGNAGGGFAHFGKGVPTVFTSEQENLGNEEIELEFRLSVMDHYVAAKEVEAQKQTVAVEANGRPQLKWSRAPLPPGFYYLTVSAWRGDQKLTETKQTFAVDLTHYSHELTRPTDWDEFWARQEQLLADTPMNATVTEIGAACLAGKAYEVTLDMLGNGKLLGCLVVPSKATGPATLGSLITERLQQDIIAKARDGSLKMPTGVQFTICLPQEATYTRWKSAEDNNLLDCVRWYLRGVDFLASRPEVKAGRIVVRGASRSGPLAVITAARRPKNVCGVSAFVHTSAGISWTDKPYVAWGLPGGHNAADANQVSRLAAMAAYVDPVNHAPDVTCPVWFGYGIDDTLAQPQGIEAMYHLCASKWKRISRDAGGHQYSPGMQKLDKELQELLSAGDRVNQDSTHKDH